jgi:hypothetical protein
MRSVTCPRVLLLLTLLLSGTAAQASTPEDSTELSAELTTSLTGMARFPLDALDTPLDRATFLEARARVGARLVRGDVELVGELDLVDGQIAGELSTVGTTRGTDTFLTRRDRLDGYYGFTPRTLYLRLTTDYGAWTVGQTTSAWGLGMVANAGRDTEGFGLARGGNVVTRVGFGTRPLSGVEGLPGLVQSTIVAASVDLVYEDDIARVVDGDLAGAAGLAVRLEDERWSLGVLGSGRLQRDRADVSDPGGQRRQLQVLALDTYARGRVWGEAEGLHLRAGAEVALTRGHTDRAMFEATREDGATIAGVGALARVEVAHGDTFLVRLEAGRASGDDDPYDDVARTFGFNTAHRVGLLLFREVLPMASARAVDRAADPALTQRPAPGLRSIVQQGGVSNAQYLYPTVRWRLDEALEFRAGYLLAATTAEWVDPFRTAQAGGYAVGPAGVPTGVALLGQELLGAVHSTWPVLGGELALVVEGSVLFPGPTLRALGMDTSWLARAGLSIRR